MKNLVMLIAAALMCTSCSKEESESDKFIGTVVDEEFTIRNSGVLNYYLGEIGEGDLVRITVEPKHQSISRLSGSQYTYEPEDSFVGEDFVELYTSLRDTLFNGNYVSKNTKTRITIYVTD